MTRRFPVAKTVAKKVALALLECSEPVTIEEGIAIHGDTGLPSKYPIQGIYDDMVANKWLVRIGKTYKLAEHVRAHYSKLQGIPYSAPPVLVQKRTCHSKGEMAPQIPDERLRKDFYFKTLGGQ